MNLQEAIEALVAAVRENTDAIRGTATVKAVATSEPPPAPVHVEQYADEPAPLTYEKDVRPVAVKLAAARGRDALVALLKTYDVSKVPELPPVMFASFIKQAQMEIEGA